MSDPSTDFTVGVNVDGPLTMCYVSLCFFMKLVRSLVEPDHRCAILGHDIRGDGKFILPVDLHVLPDFILGIAV